LARDTPSVVPTTGSFQTVTFTLDPAAPATLAAGRRLELRLAVVNGSSDDVWLGYDATGFPGLLVLGS
jgi:hypothetical protein